MKKRFFGIILFIFMFFFVGCTTTEITKYTYELEIRNFLYQKE